LKESVGRHEIFRRALKSSAVEASFARVGSMFSLFFSKRTPSSFDDVVKTERRRYTRFFHESLKRGVFFAPSPFESNFLSLAHSEEELQELAPLLEEVFKCLS
jgi:glutamate-1-semialdehyde 2,1-aminomutase